MIMSKNHPKFNVRLNTGVSSSEPISSGITGSQNPLQPVFLDVPEVKINIVFLDCCLYSFDINDIEFTNMLPENELYIDPYIKENVEWLFENVGQLGNHNQWKPCIFSNSDSQRMQKIVSQYLKNKENINDEFYKTDLNYSKANLDRGKFRLIAHFICRNQGKEQKYYLSITFFDPYHLFIPSKFGKLSKEQNMEHIYSDRHKSSLKFNKKFSDFYKKELDKVNTIQEI